MVLYDPMGDDMLQLVIGHPATNKTLFPRRAPPWAGDISKLSSAQLRSCHAFAQYAINNLRGMEGTTEYNGNQVSEAAVKVATDYPHTGEGTFGGLSEQERRQQQYAKAEASVDSLERELNSRNARTGGARVTNEPMTDGGRDVEAEPEV